MTTDHRDRLLTVAEAGDEWHLGTGERYVRRLISERRIRFVKLGLGQRGNVRIPESAVREFIEAGTVPAAR
jgi:excisionase family DNA binding protein